MDSVLYILVPCYNEEEVLHSTSERLAHKLQSLAASGMVSHMSKVVFVDDGSRDSTWAIIEDLCARSSVFAGLKLSRNRGHQNALLAGLMTIKDEADMVITIDADLQDDIETIDAMVVEYNNGCDIVYGVRSNRDSDSFFKRATAQGYYKLLRSLGCDIIYNHADYRLMSSRALQALSEYSEQRLFLRGLVPLLGYKTATVEYTRGVREAGESKYPLKRMLTLAIDGLLALSLRPLRMISATGMVMLFISALIFIGSVVRIVRGTFTPALDLIVFSIWLIGGIITTSLGIVGEYVGRASFEVKKRPRFFVEKINGISGNRNDSNDSNHDNYGNGHGNCYDNISDSGYDDSNDDSDDRKGDENRGVLDGSADE